LAGRFQLGISTNAFDGRTEEIMSEKRTGLVLSVGRLWVMTLPFRLGFRSQALGFRPGVKNLFVYEFRRL